VTPFLTFYTPTFRRPKQLAACLASVAAQTAVERIEHIVVVDHIGLGIDGMYARIPSYVDAVHGRYVHVLADDDVLVDPEGVATVEAFANLMGHPEVILVRALKGELELPLNPVWPPQLGRIDLGCLIVRADIWKQHVTAYGQRYEGDYDFAAALGGYAAHYLPFRFLRGAVSRGCAEAA